MIALFGPIPCSLFDSAMFYNDHFYNNGTLRNKALENRGELVFCENLRYNARSVYDNDPLARYWKRHATVSALTRDMAAASNESRNFFVDFIIGVLQYDHNKRLTPHEALCHPFIGTCSDKKMILTLQRWGRDLQTQQEQVESNTTKSPKFRFLELQSVDDTEESPLALPPPKTTTAQLSPTKTKRHIVDNVSRPKKKPKLTHTPSVVSSPDEKWYSGSETPLNDMDDDIILLSNTSITWQRS
mmetsp:Transcript_12958/g.14350  ORF Transcript_12958/g.14350 Transcript_12958/m.14350 type:complete len:243 (-) Transcript_12958:31-759(-)